MIFSIVVDKSFDKIEHIFVIKALKELGIEGMYLNIIKAKYDICRVSIILKGEN
jgi:hypothetical protein